MRQPRRSVPSSQPQQGQEQSSGVVEDLYEPPGSDLSSGYVSYGETDSLGSMGDLQDDSDEDVSVDVP